MSDGHATLPVPEDLALETLLLRQLAEIPDPLVAFSGGVDSSYLLAVAVEARGPSRVRAVLGFSPSLAASQREQARRVAAGLGVAIEELATREIDRPEYRANLGDRCYFCKDTLFVALRARHPEATILDGTNADDLQGHRPGRRAAAEQGVQSPLADLGFSKAAIRRLSRARGLPTAGQPASPCLASRFPAGEPVTETGLRRIEAAEDFLHGLGFAVSRVRHHGDFARIEVPLADLPLLAGTDLGREVTARLEALGWSAVVLDPQGYRSGSGSVLPV